MKLIKDIQYFFPSVFFNYQADITWHVCMSEKRLDAEDGRFWSCAKEGCLIIKVMSLPKEWMKVLKFFFLVYLKKHVYVCHGDMTEDKF